MPYKVVKNGDEWCVHKEDADGKPTGNSLGCHPSRGKADAQMRALYASENKALRDELDALKASLIPEPPVDPDDTDETAPVDVAVDPAVIAPLPDESVAVTEPDEPVENKALFERVWERIQKRLGAKSDDAVGFKVVGNHWFLTWTNNFKDRDQQIFPEREIKAYLQRVDMGIVPMPELWFWHGVKGASTRIGMTEVIGGHGHFGIAAGSFDDTPRGRKARDYYAKNAKQTRVSHGFTYPVDLFDGKHFKHFNTFEISLLPRGAEANLFTSLEGVKAMELSAGKRAEFEKIFGKDELDSILANLDEKGKALEELAVEYKDFAATEPEAEATGEKAAQVETALKELVQQVIADSAEPIRAATEALRAAKASSEEVVALQSEVKALREEVAAIKSGVPRASQSDDTVVETSHLSEALKQELAKQNERIDPFWNTKVSTTPGSNGAH